MFCKNCGNKLPKDCLCCEKCGALTDEFNAIADKVANSNNADKNKTQANFVISVISAIVAVLLFIIGLVNQIAIIFPFVLIALYVANRFFDEFDLSPDEEKTSGQKKLSEISNVISIFMILIAAISGFMIVCGVIALFANK